MTDINPFTIADTGTYIKAIRSGRITFGAPGTTSISIGGNSTQSLNATLLGASVGDIFIPVVVSGFSGCVRLESIYPTGTDTVTAVFANGDATTTAGASTVVIEYLWFDLT